MRLFVLLFPILFLCQTIVSDISPISFLTKDDTPISESGTDIDIEASIYDHNVFRSYNLDISGDNLKLMTAKPSNETKVNCAFTINYGTSFAKQYISPTIGCKYSGSVGSLRICFNEYDVFNGNCRRLSIGVDMQEFKDTSIERSNDIIGTDSFLTRFRKFSFNAMAVDYSMMSERTSFYLLKQLGIVAPYSSHVKLFINNAYMGIYSLIEPIDKKFTSLRFGTDLRQGAGGLYKELWFNPLHTKNNEIIADTRKSGPKEDDLFIARIMRAIVSLDMSTLTQQAAFTLLDRYFDTESFINITAFDAVIGSWDNYRVRHNFYLYVRKDKEHRRIVFIPSDYDRLYDAGPEKGLVEGKPWWDFSTATPSKCNAPITTAQQKALSAGGSPAMIAYNTDLYTNLPPDINIPFTCDKFSQLLSIGLAAKVRERTRYFSSQINMKNVRDKWKQWSTQIQMGVMYDMSGPNLQKMYQEQNILYNSITRATQYALMQANVVEIKLI